MSGSAKLPARKIISALFGSAEFAAPNAAAPLCRWFEVGFPERGKISIIDVRGVDDSAAIHVRDELKYRAADIIFFIRDERIAQELEKREVADLNSYLSWNETLETDRKIIEIIVPPLETIAFARSQRLRCDTRRTRRRIKSRDTRRVFGNFAAGSCG